MERPDDDEPASLALDNPFPGAASFYVPRTGSTMDLARRLSAWAPYGLVRAGEQSSGRGRLPGRRWLGTPGECLLATFWFPAGEYGDAPLPLLAGLAVVRACLSWAADSGASFSAGIGLKWPNDVLCGGRKLSGVLCEASGGSIYAGVGVNLVQAAFPAGLRTEPSSIYLETGLAPEPDELLSRLAGEFHALRGVGREWRAAYEALLVWKGRPVLFRPGLGRDSVEGVLRGVDDSGAVRLAAGPDGREAAYPSGELSARY